MLAFLLIKVITHGGYSRNFQQPLVARRINRSFICQDKKFTHIPEIDEVQACLHVEATPNVLATYLRRVSYPGHSALASKQSFSSTNGDVYGMQTNVFVELVTCVHGCGRHGRNARFVLPSLSQEHRPKICGRSYSFTLHPEDSLDQTSASLPHCQQ